VPIAPLRLPARLREMEARNAAPQRADGSAPHWRQPEICAAWRDRPEGAGRVHHAIREQSPHPTEEFLPREGIPASLRGLEYCRTYIGARQRQAPSHTESILYSPVCFALRTLTPVRSRPAENITEEEICREREQWKLRKRYQGKRLEVDLLRQHLATEGDAPIQGHGRKIGAAGPFLLCPRLQSGHHAKQCGLGEV
jgi:hypothetical protein